MVRSGVQPESERGKDLRPRRSRRPSRRQLLCPVHPDSPLEGNGRKYFLHLLTPAELRQRGLSGKRARLVLQAYPVLVLSNEWLEELWCAHCGQCRWCHVTRHDRVRHSVRWAPRELWQQVAHVDPVGANPSVSEYSRRQARQRDGRRRDGRRWAGG
ncbi:MAG: hypothetical protein AAFX65_05605 [Cyanobacteria bacterium J06638_7]